PFQRRHAVRIELHGLAQCPANRLNNVPMHLMAHSGRVDGYAAVITHPHLRHMHRAGLRIDLYVTYPGAIRRPHPRKSAMYVLMLREAASAAYMRSLWINDAGRPIGGRNPACSLGNSQ